MTKFKKTEEKRVPKGKANSTILTFALGMILFGAIMIFDASVYLADQPPFNDQFHFLKLHLVWLIIGLVPSLIIYFWDYREFSKFAVVAFIINVIMLIAVLFVSKDINGSRRWLSLGVDQIAIQPAEFIKPVFIMYLASWLAKEHQEYKTFRDALKFGFGQKLLGFIVILGIVLLLVLLEPDLGTTAIVAATAFAIFYVSGTDIAHIVGSVLVGGLFAIMGVIAAIIAPYRLDRVRTFLNLIIHGEIKNPTGEDYQIYQILIGIGSAGFWGKGFGQSRQRFGYLVENTAFTDSIFAVILEELGMLGGIILIAFWILFLRTGLQIAEKAPDKQGRLMAIGITVWLTLQAFMNMAANVGLIPLTGVPLPFITYGGSGTIVAMVGIAILLNISRFTNNGGKYGKITR